MLDPRFAAVDARLEGVKRILAVTGGKGGIGKSFVASTLAAVLASAGRRVGLLDLDFTSPSDHVILGFETGFPSEEFGIDPHVHHGIHTMTIAHFSGDAPAPLRGDDVTNALLELLAITRWGELDVLVIDMPPGLGDAALDTIRLLKRAEYLVVAQSSKVVLESVRRAMQLLRNLDVPMLGVLENMRRGESDAVSTLAKTFDLPILGRMPYDETVEDALGDVPALLQTDPAMVIRDAAQSLGV